MSNTPDQLSVSDLELFNRTQALLATAQATSAFVLQHIARTYQLEPTDTLDASGAIVRSDVPPLEPDPEREGE